MVVPVSIIILSRCVVIIRRIVLLLLLLLYIIDYRSLHRSGRESGREREKSENIPVHGPEYDPLTDQHDLAPQSIRDSSSNTLYSSIDRPKQHIAHSLDMSHSTILH